jgi:hypothetical protein
MSSHTQLLLSADLFNQVGMSTFDQVNMSSIASNPSHSNGSGQAGLKGLGPYGEKLPSLYYKSQQLASGGGGRVPPPGRPVAASDGDDMSDIFRAVIDEVFRAVIDEVWETKEGRWCIRCHTPEGTVFRAMVPRWISDTAPELLKPGAIAILPSKPPMGFTEKGWSEVLRIIGPEPMPVETPPRTTPATIPDLGQVIEEPGMLQWAFRLILEFAARLDGYDPQRA